MINEVDTDPIVVACTAANCTSCHCAVLIDLPVDPAHYDPDIDLCMNCGRCTWEVVE